MPEPVFARVMREARQQWTYQAKLAQAVGPLNGLRLRALGLLARGGAQRPGIAMHPPCLLHPVHLRAGSTDPQTYHQVLVEEQYGPLLAAEPEIIVDCGANAGFTAAYFLSRLPRSRVIAIEPFADNAMLCRRNLAPYGERAKVIEAGVWSRSCRLVIEGQTGSEWGVRVRLARPGEAGDVDAIGIADLGLPRIDLLKVDIEGSEAELFGNGAGAWLPQVNTLAVELHGEACERAMRDALAGFGGEWSTAGELTIVRGIRPMAAA